MKVYIVISFLINLIVNQGNQNNWSNKNNINSKKRRPPETEKSLNGKIDNMLNILGELSNQKLNLKYDSLYAIQDLKEENDKNALYGFQKISAGAKKIRSINRVLTNLRRNKKWVFALKRQLRREKQIREQVLLKMNSISRINSNILQIKNNIKENFVDKIEEMMKKVKKLNELRGKLKDDIYLIQNNIPSTNSFKKDDPQLNMRINESNKCLERSSCSLCLENSDCIWCGLTNQCVLGDVNGSYDNSCKESFFALKCMDTICSHFDNCEQCLEHENCGWCNDSRRCFEGDIKSPFKIKCYDYFHRKTRMCESKLKLKKRK